MELYTPSKKILESIDFNNESIHQMTTFSTKVPESTITTYMDSFMLLIMAHYNKREIDLREKNKFTSDIQNVVMEGLLNAKIHGSKGLTPFSHIVLIGDNGVCQGFHDEGNFYKRYDIKTKIENRIIIDEINQDYTLGTHVGLYAYIYPKTDLLEVDTDKGILYCSHLIKSK